MAQSPNGNHDPKSHAYLKEQLAHFRDCNEDRHYLEQHQEELQKVLSHSLNTDSLFHEGVATLLAVAHFIYRQDNQSVWQHLTWDALLGALALKDSAIQSQIMNVLSRFSMLEGKHELARQNIEKALARAQEDNNDLALLWAYIRFFEYLVYQPANFSRNEVVKRVLALAERVNEPRASFALHHALAHFYNRWGDYQRALGHGQMAYVLARRQHSNRDMLKASYVLVGICRLNFLPAARHFLKVAESVDETHLSIIDQVSVLAQQCGLYYEMGQYQAAVDGYRDAIVLLQHLNRPFHLASCLQGLALSEIRLKQFDEAQAHLEQAEELWKSYGSPFELANLRFSQGFLEANRGKKRFAVRLLEDALTMTDSIPDMASRDNIRASILVFKERVETGQQLEDNPRLAE